MTFFSFGVLCHEMLSGELPFRGALADEIVLAIREAPVPSLPKEIPASVQDITVQCLQKNPADRFRSFAEIRKALSRAIREDSTAKANNNAPC